MVKLKFRDLFCINRFSAIIFRHLDVVFCCYINKVRVITINLNLTDFKKFLKKCNKALSTAVLKMHR